MSGGREVEDREPTKAECGPQIRIDPRTGVIRSAVRECSCHPVDDPPQLFGGTLPRKESSDKTAHGSVVVERDVWSERI
jgi:hypothetical protein